ncbi:MAG: hypothetical protein IID51_04590 [Proteobacteria bacterium]|nr:hypothetical protein [Pseudomonadota bacterium]
MFMSRILILPVIVAGLALAATGATGTASANDGAQRERGMDHLANHLLEVIEEAHHNPALLDHAFFESMATFESDDYLHLAFYRALPGINWYRNHDARNWALVNQPHYYHDFLEANEVTVAVLVDSNDAHVASMVADRVASSLPPHAVYSNDPNYADIVVSLRLGDMEPQYREKSRKAKRKKYKKAYRSKPPVEEQVHYANYTKVKERVSVALSYELEISAGQQRISLERASMTFRESFSYGVDFQAYGPSGTLRNVPCPSKKLRKLMERDVETRRSEIATRLVGLAAARVATMVDYDALPLRSEMPRVRNSL